jgi:alpha-N-arabinofuranosidase
MDRNVFGSFLEHLGRAIYEGVYDPGSKLADANGFRTDVMDEFASSAFRSFVIPAATLFQATTGSMASGRSRIALACSTKRGIRSRRINSAQRIHGMVQGRRTLPLMALNLGTGTAEQAAALVEYCNVDSGTRWSDLRRKHGYAQPYNVKNWCLATKWMAAGRSVK